MTQCPLATNCQMRSFGEIRNSIDPIFFLDASSRVRLFVCPFVCLSYITRFVVVALFFTCQLCYRDVEALSMM